MEDKYDDTFLARWLNGDISAAEKTRFESSSEYQDYIRIIEGTNQFEAPSFDKESLLSKIHDKKETKTTIYSWKRTTLSNEKRYSLNQKK